MELVVTTLVVLSDSIPPLRDAIATTDAHSRSK